MHHLRTGSSASEGIAHLAPEFRLAERIAANRTVAGVHFPVDSTAGAVLGVRIGTAILGLFGAVDAADGTEQTVEFPEDPGDFGLQDLAQTWVTAGATLPVPAAEAALLAPYWTQFVTPEWP
jgi:hypothetical protein